MPEPQDPVPLAASQLGLVALLLKLCHCTKKFCELLQAEWSTLNVTEINFNPSKWISLMDIISPLLKEKIHVYHVHGHVKWHK